MTHMRESVNSFVLISMVSASNQTQRGRERMESEGAGEGHTRNSAVNTATLSSLTPL